MRSRNICKFTASHTSEALSISCFILETDIAVMKTGCTLAAGYRIMLIIEGEGKINIDSESLSFGKGDLIFASRGERLSVDCKKNCIYLLKNV